MSKMISYKLPCSTKMNYPEKIGYLTRKGSEIVFHAYSHKTHEAYLITPKVKGIEILQTGSTDEIINEYESLSGEESTIIDANGTFYFKILNENYQQNLVGRIGGIDLVAVSESDEFVINDRGGKVYKDISKHDQLVITKEGNEYHVLSAGFNMWNDDPQAMVTIEENGDSVVYLLPNEYEGWINHLQELSLAGMKLLSSVVEFSSVNGNYVADFVE